MPCRGPATSLSGAPSGSILAGQEGLQSSLSLSPQLQSFSRFISFLPAIPVSLWTRNITPSGSQKVVEGNGGALQDPKAEFLVGPHEGLIPEPGATRIVPWLLGLSSWLFPLTLLTSLSSEWLLCLSKFVTGVATPVPALCGPQRPCFYFFAYLDDFSFFLCCWALQGCP